MPGKMQNAPSIASEPGRKSKTLIISISLFSVLLILIFHFAPNRQLDGSLANGIERLTR
jgi:hypothetical protein